MKKIKVLKSVFLVLVTALVFAFSSVASAAGTNNVAEVNGTGYETLSAAISAAPEGGTVKLLSDVNLTSEIEVSKEININLNEQTITSTAQNVFKFNADTTIINGKIINNYTGMNAKVINSRAAIELKVENVDIEIFKSANSQPINIGGTTNGTVVNIKDSSINANNSGYAIIAWVQCEVSVENSELKGYATLYFKDDGNTSSEGSSVTVKNSALTGYAYENETFGAIVFEAKDIDVAIQGGSLKIERAKQGDYEVLAFPVFDKAIGSTNSSVEFDGTEVVSLNGVTSAEIVAFLELDGNVISIYSVEDYIKILSTLDLAEEYKLKVYKEVDFSEIIELSTARRVAVNTLAIYADSLGVTKAEVANYDELVLAINEASLTEVEVKLLAAKDAVKTIADAKNVSTETPDINDKEESVVVEKDNDGLTIALVIASIIALAAVGVSIYLVIEFKKLPPIPQEENITWEESEDTVVTESETISLEQEETDDDIFSKLNKKPVVPFAVRLENTTEQNKEFYQAIKAKLSENSKVKSRISNRGESFRVGRKLIAKITIVGSTLKVYLALNPNEFDTNIYHQKDASDKKMYEEVPLMMRVRSPRACKRSIDLILTMLKKQ